MESSVPVARIDLCALRHNYGEVRRLLAPSVGILAMVKADAYGHGAEQVAKTLAREGCSSFGVATLAEAEIVAAAVPQAAVVVFGGILPEEAREAVRLRAEIVTDCCEVIDALGSAATAAARQVNVHVKVDTGMRRLGVDASEVPELLLRIEATPGTKAVALCSHFAMAESVSGEVTHGQLERLLDARAAARERGLSLACHLANSAAVMTRPETHLDLVRPGLMLYGLLPHRSLADRARLRPVMTFEAAIVRVARVGRGQGVGYGHTGRTTRDTRLATIRCGYADGYPRALSNRGEVLIAGRRAALIGRVCMDHTMVDVTDLGPVARGDRAVLWGAEPSAEEVAARCGTITYELVARVAGRVPRQYSGA